MCPATNQINTFTEDIIVFTKKTDCQKLKHLKTYAIQEKNIFKDYLKNLCLDKTG